MTGQDDFEEGLSVGEIAKATGRESLEILKEVSRKSMIVCKFISRDSVFVVIPQKNVRNLVNSGESLSVWALRSKLTSQYFLDEEATQVGSSVQIRLFASERTFNGPNTIKLSAQHTKVLLKKFSLKKATNIPQGDDLLVLVGANNLIEYLNARPQERAACIRANRWRTAKLAQLLVTHRQQYIPNVDHEEETIRKILDRCKASLDKV